MTPPTQGKGGVNVLIVLVNGCALHAKPESGCPGGNKRDWQKRGLTIVLQTLHRLLQRLKPLARGLANFRVRVGRNAFCLCTA